MRLEPALPDYLGRAPLLVPQSGQGAVGNTYENPLLAVHL